MGLEPALPRFRIRHQICDRDHLAIVRGIWLRNSSVKSVMSIEDDPQNGT